MSIKRPILLIVPALAVTMILTGGAFVNPAQSVVEPTHSSPVFMAAHLPLPPVPIAGDYGVENVHFDDNAGIDPMITGRKS